MNATIIKRGIKPTARFNLWVLVVIVAGSVVAIVKAQGDHSTYHPASDYHGPNPAYWVISDR